MKKFVVLLAIFAVFTVSAYADIRLPDQQKSKTSDKTSKSIDSELVIRLDPNAKEARLIIPRSEVKQLRAQLDELEGGDKNTSAAVNFTRVQTIVSGLFFSLAIVFGGVWMTRSRKIKTPNDKVLSIGAGLFITGALATITLGNVAPPPVETRSISDKLFSQPILRYKYARGDVKLEIADDTDEIQLIVPAKSSNNGSREE